MRLAFKAGAVKRDYVPLFGAINTSTKLADLPDHRPRLFYVLLLPQCDSWGRCTADARQLCARVWPMLGETPKSTAAALAELAKVGLVVVHESSGRRWVQVPDWEQKAGKVGHSDRRGSSEWPDPPQDQSGLTPDSIRTTPVSVPSEESRGEQRRGSPRGLPRLPIPESVKGTVLDTPAFVEAMESWESSHGRYKPAGLRAQLHRLTTWGPDRAVAAIRYSLAQGFQGIYEDKGANGANQQNGHKPAPAKTARDLVYGSIEWCRMTNSDPADHGHSTTGATK